MLELFATRLCSAYANTLGHRDAVRAREKSDPTATISRDHINFIIGNGVRPFIEVLDEMKLDEELIYRCKRFQVQLGRPHSIWMAEHLVNALDNFLIDILRVLEKHRFAFIPAGRAELFGVEAPFGKCVFDKIADARQDARDAADCMAFELHTACVFHLMRVAEHGLRKLAKSRRVVVLHNKRPSAYEDEDWSKLIDGIKRKLDKARKITSKPKKRAVLQLHSDLTDHCLFIRDLFRNDVSHTRSPYTPEETKNAWDRVERFMQLIAASTK